MAPLRSLGNIISAFDDFYARTGGDAAADSSPGVVGASGAFAAWAAEAVAAKKDVLAAAVVVLLELLHYRQETIHLL